MLILRPSKFILYESIAKVCVSPREYVSPKHCSVVVVESVNPKENPCVIPFKIVSDLKELKYGTLTSVEKGISEL